MKKTIIVSLVLNLYVIDVLYAVPQTLSKRQIQQTQSEKDRLIDIEIEKTFGTATEPTISTLVVTPDPTYVPTSSPQNLVINEQNCTCVPYHMCDPTTNTVKSDPVNTDEITGFGNIDIRFDSHDCQEILDVCCVGVATKEVSIQPKPIKNVPTQEAGCGVRNVGGLDFTITGAFVSQNFKISIFQFSKC